MSEKNLRTEAAGRLWLLYIFLPMLLAALLFAVVLVAVWSDFQGFGD